MKSFLMTRPSAPAVITIRSRAIHGLHWLLDGGNCGARRWAGEAGGRGGSARLAMKDRVDVRLFCSTARRDQRRHAPGHALVAPVREKFLRVRVGAAVGGVDRILRQSIGQQLQTNGGAQIDESFARGDSP